MTRVGAGHRGCHDRGRTAVGAAEQASFGGTDLEDEWSIDELAGIAAGVVGGSWWRAAGGPAVVVVAARATARSSSARVAAPGPPSSAAVEVRLAGGQRDIATLAHELAHALAGIDHGHDDRFRAAQVDLVTVLAGQGHGRSLTACFGSFGLAVGARTWPAPAVVAGDSFLLRS